MCFTVLHIVGYISIFCHSGSSSSPGNASILFSAVTFVLFVETVTRPLLSQLLVFFFSPPQSPGLTSPPLSVSFRRLDGGLREKNRKIKDESNKGRGRRYRHHCNNRKFEALTQGLVILKV
uniref:Uncharacterized protein n=1 Tax=Labrus bergylta TaxID=56723 RepID=A0A3Q3L0K9_9LABR